METKITIKEGNELIARFMGYELITPEMRKTSLLNRSYWQRGYPDKQDVLCEEGQLDYHRKIHLLLPACRKFCSIPTDNPYFPLKSKSNSKEYPGLKLSEIQANIERSITYYTRSQSEITDIFNTLIEGIKWYNSNIKQ